MKQVKPIVLTLKVSNSDLARYTQSAKNMDVNRSEMIRRAVSSYLLNQNPIAN